MLRTKKQTFNFLLSSVLLTSFLVPAITSAQSISKPAINPSQVGSALVGCLSINTKLAKFVTGFTSKVNATQVAVNNPTDNNRKDCLDKVGYLAARLAIQQITNRTIAWINTGFDGNPFWTTEDQTLYDKISNTQIKDLVAPYALTKTQGQEFAKDIARQLIIESKTTVDRKTGFTGPGRTFTNNFQAGGGWKSWYNLTSNPANDPIGFALLLTQQKEQVVSQKIAEVSRELQTNDGFLSQKKCVNPTNYKPLSDYEKKQAQGQSSASVISQETFMQNYFNTAGVSRDLTPNKTTGVLEHVPAYYSTLTKATNEYSKLVTQANQNAADAKTSVDNSTCLEWKTLTPGKIISNQLDSVLGSPIRQAELADTLNEQLSAVFDALLNQLAQKGLNSLSQKSTYNYKSMFPTNNLGFSTDTTARDAANTGDYWQNSGDDTNPFKVRTLIQPKDERADGILKTQSTFLNILSDMSKNINTVQEDIGELDYCVPGPTPNWRDNVEASINQITSFAYSIPSDKWYQPDSARDQLYEYIKGNFNVTNYNDNTDTVKKTDDQWLNGSVDKKIKNIKIAYDAYSTIISDRYENPTNYIATQELRDMWTLRQTVVSEFDRTDEYNQALSDNAVQSRLTNEAVNTVDILKPKYNALFAEVCANVIDGVTVNAHKLPCVCDATLHPTLNRGLIRGTSYEKQYYNTCVNAGYKYNK